VDPSLPDQPDPSEAEIIDEIAATIREVLTRRLTMEAMERMHLPHECAQAVYAAVKPRVADPS
jgi:hypothetical protein